jgi:hypothetical protein
MTKTRQYDTTMMKRRKTIVFSSSYCRVFTIVVSWFCVFIIVVSYCRVFTIVLLRFHHRTVVFSSSFYRVFIIALSRFHHRSFVFSSSYYGFFIIVLSRFHHRTVAFSSSHCRVFIYWQYKGKKIRRCLDNRWIMLLGNKWVWPENRI